MVEEFKMPPPTQYSAEELLEIGDAMERLGATMDRLREKEKILHPNETKGEAKLNSSKINTDFSKIGNQRDC